jgi:hypothetical protein
MPNIFEEVEEGKRWKKENGSFVNKLPSSGFLKWTTENGTPYYQNISSGETVWELPRNRANSANTIASLESNLSSLRSECSAKDAKIAELEAKLKTCGPGPSAAPAAAAANNSGPAAKFKKMLKMGIPRVAVEQKMRMEGLEPSLLNAASSAAPASAEPAATPFRPPMGGPMAGLLAGIGSAKLKKTEGPINKGPAKEEKPKTGAQSAAASLAEAAAAKRLAMKTNVGNLEARLAASKAAKAAAGESLFKKELRSVVASKTGNAVAAPVLKRQVLNANEQGRLPKGWKYVIDEDGDKYYVKANGTSQWERPSEGGARKGKRKTRKSTRRNRKTRRVRN